MLRDLLTTAALLLIALVLYGFRAPILAALARFDAQNVARRREEIQDRRDQLAHYKHTLRLAEEQIEEIQPFEAQDERTAEPVTHYLFEGETFVSRDEAEAARQRAIVAKARDFYVELPIALAKARKGKLN
jgi:hemolysin activation/secretion protein